MSLKTKLVLAITGLVFLVTVVLSLVYVSQLLERSAGSPTTPMCWARSRFAMPCNWRSRAG
jgi:hypothetical protein